MKRLALLLLAGCSSPTFDLPATDGAWVSLDDFAGRTVVINFWAPWCGSCENELRTFEALSRAHPDVAFVGIADASLQEIAAFAGRLGVTFPMLKADATTRRDWGISVYPTTVIVRPDGRERIFGPREAEVWESLLYANSQLNVGRTTPPRPRARSRRRRPPPSPWRCRRARSARG